MDEHLAEKELQLRGARALLVRAERHTYHKYGPNEACRILSELRKEFDRQLTAHQDRADSLVSGTWGSN